ncbi:uncharacterized protein [Primulina eburnea]|uniref:uncharacterized protein n=1 Tax=Primulina eburnea TaxID=1245227 RepID=UPI003C6C033A
MFSRSLSTAACLPDFNYHPKCEPLRITHLAYADDLLLFSRGDIGSVSIIVDSLKELLRISYYSPLLDKLSSKINAWPRKSLSHIVRLELIRSVLQGVECYWMSILPLPDGVIEKIYGLCRSFFWLSKQPSISWKKICRPIESGRLGLRDLRAWNKALLSKVLWNIHEKKDTLWIKWVNLYYFNDFWSWKPKRDDSPLLKFLVNRDKLTPSMGSTDEAKAMLSGWNEGTNSLLKAYLWFSPNQLIWPWKPLVWKSNTISKHRFSLWLFAHQKFLNKDRQPYVLDKVCVLCNQFVESFDHLFFQCPLTKYVWNRVREWLGLRKTMGSATALLAAFRSTYRGSSRVEKMRIAAIAATIYFIRDMRNRKLFDDDMVPCDRVVRKIQIAWYTNCGDVGLDLHC